MKSFEFNSAICTSVEQSKRLLELGLKKETADMYRPPSWGGGKIIGYYAPAVVLFNDHFAEEPNDLPAWSLHRLLQIINRDMVIKPYTTFDDIIADIDGLIKTQLIYWRYLEEDKQ